MGLPFKYADFSNNMGRGLTQKEIKKIIASNKEVKMQKAIMISCKDCGEIFFAAIQNEKNIRDSGEEIIKYLAEGHTIKQFDADLATIKLGKCKC